MRKLESKMLEATYRSWTMMRNRCNNQNARDWEYYGGRGIKHCERWNTWELFLEDMGERPSMAHTLDREDNDGDYTPDNCSWATKAKQAQNRSYCKMTMETANELRSKYSKGGVRQIDLAEEYNISQRNVCQILRNEIWKSKDFPAQSRKLNKSST